MPDLTQLEFDYFTRQSPLSSPGKYAAYFEGLPRDIHALCEIIQGFLLHAFWISEENYGVCGRNVEIPERSQCGV